MVQNESADAFRPKKRGCPFLLEDYPYKPYSTLQYPA